MSLMKFSLDLAAWSAKLHHGLDEQHRIKLITSLFVLPQDELQYLYNFMLEYLDCFEEYANFK